MVVLLVFSLIYFILLVLAIIQWKILIQRKLPPLKHPDQCLSVIVPARNEEANLSALFEAFSKQSFPPTHFEVLLIDDHSEDSTVSTAKSMSEGLSFPLKVISLREEGEAKGKKSALQKGIEEAKGTIIVTTDADCVMGENWLQSIHDYFALKAAKMVVGPVTYHVTGGLFGQLQLIEFAALIGVGAVSLDVGKPNMCNGANLAFEKRAFEKVGGHKDNLHIPSGDDEFLLQKIYKEFPDQVFFNNNPEGIVATYPMKKIKDFVAQRKRWGGKGRLHKSKGVKLLALFIFFYHVMLLAAFIWTALGFLNLYIFMGVFLAKGMLEYFFLKKVLHHLGKPLYFKHFVVLQTVYSLYILVIGMLANFGSFYWKGRKY